MTDGRAAALPPSPDTRFLLGTAVGVVPVAVIILTGSALGPYGLGLLSADVLASIDPAMPVALAALGVLVGMDVKLHTARDRRAFAAAAVRGTTTMALVGAGVAAAVGLSVPVSEAAPWLNSGLLAISAADDPVAVLVGGGALALVREASPGAAGMLLLQATGVTLAIAVSGWLLLSPSASGTEQRIFVIALLLLLGGAAEYLSLSALAAGLVAGVFWETAGGSTRVAVRRDVAYVQRPLILLILAVSGARLVLTPVVLAVALPYLVMRLVGLIAGAVVARRLFPPSPATDAGTSPEWPGIVGLGFALNAVRVTDVEVNTFVSIVVIGIVGSHLLASFGDKRGTGE
jgi:hypothetical protein